MLGIGLTQSICVLENQIQWVQDYIGFWSRIFSEHQESIKKLPYTGENTG